RLRGVRSATNSSNPRQKSAATIPASGSNSSVTNPYKVSSTDSLPSVVRPAVRFTVSVILPSHLDHESGGGDTGCTARCVLLPRPTTGADRTDQGSVGTSDQHRTGLCQQPAP